MKSRKKMNTAADSRGFTMVEILIAIGISGFVLAGLFTAFLAQQRLYHVNEQVSEMQQNLRGAVMLITREARMAGYDPTGDAGAGIVEAGPFRFQFTQDINDDAETGTPDGDCEETNENITFGFLAADDTNNDGIANGGAGSLGRRATEDGNFQTIAENIMAVGFAYGYEDDGVTAWAVDTDDPPNEYLNIMLDTNDDGIIDADDDTNDDGLINGQVLAGSGIPYDQIYAVRIWILARSRQPDKNFTDTSTYVVGRNVIKPADLQKGYRYRLLETTIELRNRK